MQVKIKNNQLKRAIDLLFNLSLKGKQSRHRTKFIKGLNERLQEVEAERIALAKEHAIKDENGDPKIINDGTEYDIEDRPAFQKDLQELYEEEIVLDGGDAQGMLKTVKDVLLNCDVAFQGQEAMTYDYLCDQFEGGEE